MPPNPNKTYPKVAQWAHRRMTWHFVLLDLAQGDINSVVCALIKPLGRKQIKLVLYRDDNFKKIKKKLSIMISGRILRTWPGVRRFDNLIKVAKCYRTFYVRIPDMFLPLYLYHWLLHSSHFDIMSIPGNVV